MLQIGFTQTDREQMLRLLEKAKAGTLDSDEADALENYQHLGRLIELMKITCASLTSEESRMT